VCCASLRSDNSDYSPALRRDGGNIREKKILYQNR
jgi:hypothetical protein